MSTHIFGPSLSLNITRVLNCLLPQPGCMLSATRIERAAFLLAGSYGNVSDFAGYQNKKRTVIEYYTPETDNLKMLLNNISNLLLLLLI